MVNSAAKATNFTLANKVLQIYLWANGVGLALLGVCCAIAPDATAELIGLKLIGPKGTAEYISVYGGIEFGLGLFFVLAALRTEFQRAGLILGLFMYASIVVFRGGSMIFNGATSDFGWLLYSVEVSCFVVALALMRSFLAPFNSKDTAKKTAAAVR